jgi:prophage maintenance system killer protein
LTSKEPDRGEIVVFEAQDGSVRLDVRLKDDTVWLSQRLIAELLDTSTDNVGLHLKNIYAEGELDERATTEDSSVVQLEGKRRVSRRVRLFNLDAILSVGYRVNSKRGTQFRIWATGTLREHLVRGYTINSQRFEHNARELEAALALVRKTAASGVLTSDQGRGLVDLIARYTQTFVLLQRYDEGLLAEPRGVKGGELPEVEAARAAIAELKHDLISRREATELFGQERANGLESLLGNLAQSVFGKPAYPTIESKAAHFLYFVIKNHPFSDGNKRIGSFLFVDFLRRNGRLVRNGEPVINDVGLAALALLVAESAPKDKDVMIRLVMNMLAEARR